jgi:hypothetical protein
MNFDLAKPVANVAESEHRTRPQSGVAAVPRLLQLQRLAGNRATTRLIQRSSPHVMQRVTDPPNQSRDLIALDDAALIAERDSVVADQGPGKVVSDGVSAE